MAGGTVYKLKCICNDQIKSQTNEGRSDMKPNKSVIKTDGNKVMLQLKAEEPEEKVVDLFSDEGTETQKFAVDSMQNRLQEVSFSGKK